MKGINEGDSVSLPRSIPRELMQRVLCAHLRLESGVRCVLKLVEPAENHTADVQLITHPKTTCASSWSTNAAKLSCISRCTTKLAKPVEWRHRGLQERLTTGPCCKFETALDDKPLPVLCLRWTSSSIIIAVFLLSLQPSNIFILRKRAVNTVNNITHNGFHYFNVSDGLFSYDLPSVQLRLLSVAYSKPGILTSLFSQILVSASHFTSTEPCIPACDFAQMYD